MISGDHEFTRGGNPKAASLATVCQWILQAWKDLKPEMIVKSFKKCCISNAMDGTEDDALWEYEEETPPSDSKDFDPYDDTILSNK